MQRKKPLIQEMSAYTPEDFEVWQQLFTRQMNLLEGHASVYYLDALKKIRFRESGIPDFEKTSELLKIFSGWKLTVVPELVPQQEFFSLLSNRVFPATCWLRTRQELDYIEEPDMFHDVFGHVPLLAHPAYALFMQGMGQLAARWLHIPEAIVLLGRIYWFTIEFGLIAHREGYRIYGAGIISSPEETRHCLHPQTKKLPFDVARIMQKDYHTDSLQEQYFVIPSFEALYASLPIISETITLILKKQVSVLH